METQQYGTQQKVYAQNLKLFCLSLNFRHFLSFDIPELLHKILTNRLLLIFQKDASREFLY